MLVAVPFEDFYISYILTVVDAIELLFAVSVSVGLMCI